jgi:hypothetical protein
MREVCEFRLKDKLASEVLPHGMGTRIGANGSVRVIEVELSDPLFQKIGELEFRMKRQYRSSFYSWDIRRHYTRAEISAAEFFALYVDSMLGEDELGDYDESNACRLCGAGGDLRSPFVLQDARTYKGRKFDVARTLDEELIFSSKAVDLLEANGITGCAWDPVRVLDRNDAKESDYFRLIVTGEPLDVVPPTKFGINPFDLDVEGEYRCKLGHVYGLVLLSEVHFMVAPDKASDFMHSVGFVGNRMGVLRPSRIVVVSARLARLLETVKPDVRFEVAHRLGAQRG